MSNRKYDDDDDDDDNDGDDDDDGDHDGHDDDDVLFLNFLYFLSQRRRWSLRLLFPYLYNCHIG